VLAVGLCASTFNDARYCYNAPFLHLYYLLVWPGFFAFLLIIDWCGGEGLLARATSDPRYLQTAVPIVIAVMFILQIVVSIIGAQWRELDAKLSAHGRLQAQLAEMRREREVIGRSCDFLVQGLAAGRFSHDVASPVSTVALSARELLDGLHDLEALAQSGKGGEPRSLALFAELRAAAERIQRGQARIAEMATTMASSLRGDSSASGTTSEALIEAASREHRAALERHRARYLEPVVEVAPSTLYLSAEHAAAIGSLLCNGSLQNPNARVRISGRVVNDWFYVIGIRDFGVDGDDRIQALQKVRRRLAFTDTQDVEAAESRSYEGLGLGLVLAKILFLRHNGCLSVASPQQGPGLLFVVVLPRRPLADIPIPDNDPEAVAERWATLLAGTMAPIESGSEPRTSSRAREDQPVVERA
jgi:signal transduction histidine kinase